MYCIVCRLSMMKQDRSNSLATAARFLEFWQRRMMTYSLSLQQTKLLRAFFFFQNCSNLVQWGFLGCDTKKNIEKTGMPDAAFFSPFQSLVKSAKLCRTLYINFQFFAKLKNIKAQNRRALSNFNVNLTLSNKILLEHSKESLR